MLPSQDMFPQTMTLNYDIQKHKSCDKNICLLHKGIPGENFHRLDKEWGQLHYHRKIGEIINYSINFNFVSK